MSPNRGAPGSARSGRVILAGAVAGLLCGAGALLAPGAHAASPLASTSPLAVAEGVGPTGAFVPSSRKEIIPVHGGTVDSLNWSGYAVTGTGITGVTARFVVPPAGAIPPGFAATWAGVGGYSTSDLIQAGVGENSAPGNFLTGPQYYAWYEMLPDSETPIAGCQPDPACTVSPGDTVAVLMAEGPGDAWHIVMVDAGHWIWSKWMLYPSSGTSAEWILEAPTVGAQTVMAPVGVVRFGPWETYTERGALRPSAAGDPTRIVLSAGVVDEASPSALARDGESFNDCSYQQSCPTPAG